MKLKTKNDFIEYYPDYIYYNNTMFYVNRKLFLHWRFLTGHTGPCMHQNNNINDYHSF